jgi:aspartate carbamoyltransferase catalytic subunit
VYRLGGSCISAENAAENSSAFKGETIEDCVKVISAYVHAIVLRHKENDTSEKAAAVSHVPIISAGNGTAHHPTQSLLDVFTIYEKFGHLDNLRVLIAGDLLRGRTCDSLVQTLAYFPNIKFYFAAPEGCKIKDSLKKFLEEKKIDFVEADSLEQYIPEVDVVYMTRVQKERFENNLDLYEKVKDLFILTPDLVSKMKPEAIILHPLPRINEIPKEVDNDPRALYFTQAENGLWVRMAILCTLLGHAQNEVLSFDKNTVNMTLDQPESKVYQTEKSLVN